MPDEEDMITERHAHVLVHGYNLAPRTTKCERTVGVGNDLCSMWLCRKDRTVRCLVLYNADRLRIGENLILNGEFYNDFFWGLDNLWQIHDGFADIEWLAATPNINLYQFLPLTVNEFYIIDFDILEATCPGGSGLRVRLGGAAGNQSSVIQTTGHKSIVLQYNNQGEWLLFYIFQSSDNPGYIKIDNVEMHVF